MSEGRGFPSCRDAVLGGASCGVEVGVEAREAGQS